MLVAIAAVVLGIGLLAWSADQFVLGSARLAIIRRVPPLVVGAVIIGFGTSAPELLVSVIASMRGQPELAVGNIVGSNIANLSLLLGAGALILPLTVASRTVKREAPLAVAAAGLFALTVRGGGISRLEGIGLLLAMAAALAIVTMRTIDDPLASDTADLVADPRPGLEGELLRTVAGLIGTVTAAQALLWGATDLAARADLAEGFVGVTLVAVGTSLPEFVTVVQSARRGETDLIVGNLVGSNLFNALTVGGLTGLVGSTTVDAPGLTSFAAMAAVAVSAIALFGMVSGRTVSRSEGTGLILGYLCLVPFLT